MGRYATAIFHGLAQWFGEAVVGLFPWLMFEYAHRFSTLPIIATCPEQSYNPASRTFFNCTRVIESPSQEICVLAVVISGLAVLSVLPIGQRNQRPITAFTHVLVVVSFVALVTGALFYAFFTAHIDREANTVALWVLAVAIVSSLCLSIESAVLSA